MHFKSESCIDTAGSARTGVVQFGGWSGGPATFLAPDRGTYGLVQPAAFHGCKDRRRIVKWWQMRAFSGSVLEWCGQGAVVRLLPGRSCRRVPAAQPQCRPLTTGKPDSTHPWRECPSPPRPSGDVSWEADCRDLTSLCLRLCTLVKLRAASVP